MRQWIFGLSVMIALGSAFALYGIAYSTRRIETRVISLERAATAAATQINALRAERAHLARPERIEPLARAAGMVPPTARHFITADQLSARMPPAPAAAPKGIEDLLSSGATGQGADK